MSKLEKLAEIEGKLVDQMLEDAVMDSACPGICMNEKCDYTVETEPDQSQGYCEKCDTNTVQSCLVIANLI